MSNLLDLLLGSVSTGAFYFLSNYHTYNIGIDSPICPPLKDFFHDILPDLSHFAKWRDYILPIVLVPLVCMSYSDSLWVLRHFVEGFMYITTLKAITIFFTFIPPSNLVCAEKKQINHCYHQMFSGHNSLVLLLALLYSSVLSKHKYIFLAFTLTYSIFILMTRAHYTVDIIVSYIIVWLLFQ